MRSGWCLALGLWLLAGPAASQTITRYDEDWSKLADPAARTARWTEPFKYIPFGGRADVYLTTGAEVRLRSETYLNNLWGGADAPNDNYLLVRAMPYADLRLGPVRVFAQPIVAYAFGVSPEPSPTDQTRVDLLQSFADVSLKLGPEFGVTLRAGRQMLSLGSERLVGTRYGPNVPLAFDGVRGLVKWSGVEVSLLGARPVRPGPQSVDDSASQSKALWGAYAKSRMLDIYYLGYRNRDARFDSVTGSELRHTLGIRSFGKAADWHWNVEAIGQFGSIADQHIRAWSIGSELGHRFTTLPFTPDVTVRFNVVSGDENRADRTLGTFNALFPKGKYFGELSPIGPYNIINLNPAVAFDLGANIVVGLAGQLYWRYARADGVYDVPGNLIRPAGEARSRFIGAQLEATISWQATPQLELSGSLSAFDAGAFLRETGPARAIVLLGLEANFHF